MFYLRTVDGDERGAFSAGADGLEEGAYRGRRLFEEKRYPHNLLTVFCTVRQAKVVCAIELTSI